MAEDKEQPVTSGDARMGTWRAKSHNLSQSKPSQPRMDKFHQKAPACTPAQAAVLTDSILNMRPLSMVEDDCFKAMISTFHPNYDLPSRTFFTKQLDKKYVDIKDEMQKALQETDTTDIWTSVATEAYMGVTCHYLKNWKMVSHCLTTMPLEERHTTANIAEWIEEVIAKFIIPPEKIKAVVHDNCANVVAAAKILHAKHGWGTVKCTGHTLNLVVQNSLKSQQVISKCVAAAEALLNTLRRVNWHAQS
ncbi:hypothetical protein PAMP_018897 [Pampus punctatissimus]